jgi:hypothetical protein
VTQLTPGQYDHIGECAAGIDAGQYGFSLQG